MTTTIKLPLTFVGTGEVRGFMFTQKHELNNGYVYEVMHDGHSHYEAFKKKSSPICVDFEKRVYSTNEFKEVYPKANDFGIWAWTLPSLEKAIEKLSKIN